MSSVCISILLGIGNFRLLKANVGNRKPYKHLYQTLLKRISIPEHIIDRVYATRIVGKFYSEQEVSRFKRRWLNHRCFGRRAAFNFGISPQTSIGRLRSSHATGASFQCANEARPCTGSEHTPKISKQFTRRGSILNLPTISLVTPSYNQGKYLEECIDSVLSQNYPNLEYIVMDGGSTDNSVEIIKRYEKYLTYWQSRPDGGQYAAITDGLRRTDGEIMTWLNSDDKYHPNAFFTVASLFMLRKDVEWITGRSNTLAENGRQRWISEYPVFWRRLKYLKKQFKDPWIQQEGTFWRRRLWEKSGATLRRDLDFAGDLELWTRFFRYARLYTADALLAGYRYQPESKARRFMDKYLQEANEVLDEELRLFKNGCYPELPPTPQPLTVRDIRQGADLIRSQAPGIDSLLDARRGWGAFKSGHQTAVEFYEKSLASNPVDARLHNSLGMLYWQAGEVPKSIVHFTSALRINPADPYFVMNLGDVLVRIKEEDKAQRLYSAYILNNPQHRDLLGMFKNTGK